MTISSPFAEGRTASRWLLAAVLVATAWGVSAPAEAADFRALYDEGATAYGAGHYEEAIGHFEAAFAIKAHPLCLFNIGQSYRKLDDLDNAIAAYEKYLATGPSDDLVKETESYLADLRRAKKGVTLAAEGFELLDSGDAATAAKRFEEAYSLRPRPRYLFYLGVAVGESGDEAGAIAAFEKFLAKGGAVELRGKAKAHLESLRAGTGLVVEDKPTPEPDGDGSGPAPDDGSTGVSVMPDGDAGAGGSAVGTDATTAPPPKKKKKTALWVGIGAGAGALVVGGAILTTVLLINFYKGPNNSDTVLGGELVEF